MSKILIVEDDNNILNILSFNLKREKYEVITCDNGLSAIEIMRSEPDISLILMDAMLPKMDGFESTEEIRKFSKVPILMLTALEGESNVLHGFDSGVNDYVIKPFSVREVLARVKSHIKTINVVEETKTPESISINNIRVFPLTNIVKVGKKENELTDTELKLLLYMYDNRNKVITRDELLEKVWGTSYFDPRTVDVTIRRLRTKIEENDAVPLTLKTRRGSGYFLNVQKT